jgi:4-diphosphocytidyl-2-C-methyl-D-erythritol kinase
LQLGADVPVFVRGRSAWAEGVGERLLPMDLDGDWFVIVDGGVRVATGELFQAPELTRNAPRMTMEDFAPGRVGENVFTPLMRARSAPLAALLDAIDNLGTGGMTGTGGGCFLLATSRQDALDKAAALSQFGHTVVSQGVARSAMLGMLERESSGRV